MPPLELKLQDIESKVTNIPINYNYKGLLVIHR